MFPKSIVHSLRKVCLGWTMLLEHVWENREILRPPTLLGHFPIILFPSLTSRLEISLGLSLEGLLLQMQNILVPFQIHGFFTHIFSLSAQLLPFLAFLQIVKSLVYCRNPLLCIVFPGDHSVLYLYCHSMEKSIWVWGLAYRAKELKC
jgi:hypothetical protein